MVSYLNRCLMSLLAITLLGVTSFAMADGTLTHLSGKVSVQKADGSTVAGTVGVKVVQGDTVITGANGFVRMELSDGGEMVIRPDTQLKIENYRYSKDSPEEDSFIFRTIKGGFRAITGLISKRGNRDAYKAHTATATIGIRGTQYDMRVCQANCGALPDGTYVAVRFGAVVAGNTQGNLDFKAGQVGFIPPNQPPVILPHDPGVGFTAPPVIPKLDEKKKQSSEQEGDSNGGENGKSSSDRSGDLNDQNKQSDDQKKSSNSADGSGADCSIQQLSLHKHSSKVALVISISSRAFSLQAVVNTKNLAMLF